MTGYCTSDSSAEQSSIATTIGRRLALTDGALLLTEQPGELGALQSGGGLTDDVDGIGRKEEAKTAEGEDGMEDDAETVEGS